MALINAIFGLVLLVVCGEGLVNGAVRIAKRFKISPLVCGMTVVAFGTSAPELIVSFGANMSGHPEMAIGNVLGSNISNIALVLALSALIFPIPIRSRRLPTDWVWMMGSSLLFLMFALDGVLVSWEGIVLFTLLLLFLFSSIRAAKNQHVQDPDADDTKESKVVFSLLLVLGASGGLALGADLLIEGASEIARNMGITEHVISVTLVAFGTSLPELAASTMAAIRKQTDISIGNIIGSNIFNVLAVIGITASFKPILVNIDDFRFDIYFMLGLSLLLMIFIFPLRNNILLYKTTHKFPALISIHNGHLGRIGSGLLLLSYVVYVLLILS